MDVQVTFDKEIFMNLFSERESILENHDVEKQNQLISQLNALFDLSYVQNIDADLVQCVQTYYLENKSRLEEARSSESIVNSDEMSLQEFNLLNKLDQVFSQYQTDVREEAQEEIDEFGIEGETHEQVMDKPKVRTLRKPKGPNDHRQAAFSTITIIIEIITVALIIMMFLSLDI